jgi:hypothetical protein
MSLMQILKSVGDKERPSRTFYYALWCSLHSELILADTNLCTGSSKINNAESSLHVNR